MYEDWLNKLISRLFTDLVFISLSHSKASQVVFAWCVLLGFVFFCAPVFRQQIKRQKANMNTFHTLANKKCGLLHRKCSLCPTSHTKTRINTAQILNWWLGNHGTSFKVGSMFLHSNWTNYFGSLFHSALSHYHLK